MLLAIAEQKVDDSANYWEEKDENGPKDLVRNGAIGLDELDYERCQ